jgi:hypothetical protein
MVGTLRKSPPMDRRPSSCLITKAPPLNTGTTISISREPHREQTSRSFQLRTGGSCAVAGGRRTRASRRSASVERFCANTHRGDYRRMPANRQHARQRGHGYRAGNHPRSSDGMRPESQVRNGLAAGGGSLERTRLWTPNFPASWEITGNFLRFGSSAPYTVGKAAAESGSYGPIPYAV